MMGSGKDTDDKIWLALRCKHARANGEACNAPLVRFFINGIGALRLTCGVCSGESEIRWGMDGVTCRPLS